MRAQVPSSRTFRSSVAARTACSIRRPSASSSGSISRSTIHNGGNILFGPDGNLYIGFGDGGSAEAIPAIASQNRNLLFGKILRINVDGADCRTRSRVTIPMPVTRCAPAGSGSAPCPEIYAYGFRNPWRWSFDRAATEPDLWLADVGQDSFEEVDRIVKRWQLRLEDPRGPSLLQPLEQLPAAPRMARR